MYQIFRHMTSFIEPRQENSVACHFIKLWTGVVRSCRDKRADPGARLPAHRVREQSGRWF